MKKLIKLLPHSITDKLIIKKIIFDTNRIVELDKKRMIKHNIFPDQNNWSYHNLEAQITKTYHSIEKGLSYNNLRLGFGKNNINTLLDLLDKYVDNNYDTNTECFKGAVGSLQSYINIHDGTGIDTTHVKERITKYGSINNIEFGGVNCHKKEEIVSNSKSNFKDFSMSRHSVRDFSNQPVDLKEILAAIDLAQNTPSACNRQSWKTRVIKDEKLKEIIRSNQNGNEGFGEKFSQILLVTGELQCFYVGRERNQVYIDGGMYAMNLLYSLHYHEIAAIPLSASLSNVQENNIRMSLDLNDSEVFIMFIGVGNYLDEYKVPKSHRRMANIEVY